jgi:hypothetical protein
MVASAALVELQAAEAAAPPSGAAPFVPFGMKKRGKETDYVLAVVVVVGIGAPLW